jgi:hypothetical protein
MRCAGFPGSSASPLGGLLYAAEPTFTPLSGTARSAWTIHFIPGGKVYINVATAKGLALTLELWEADGTGLVRYR